VHIGPSALCLALGRYFTNGSWYLSRSCCGSILYTRKLSIREIKGMGFLRVNSGLRKWNGRAMDVKFINFVL